MLETLKPFYNSTLRPLSRVLLKCGIHPNVVTATGLACFIVGGWLCSQSKWHYALVAVIIGSCMDGLDGLLARESGKQSEFGAIFDSTCDRFTEMALLGGLSWYYLLQKNSPGVILCFSALCGSVMVSYIKARCEGFGIVCNRGVLQRPERLILLGFGLLAGPGAMVIVLGIVTGLGFFTVFERILIAFKGEKRKNADTTNL